MPFLPGLKERVLVAFLGSSELLVFNHGVYCVIAFDVVKAGCCLFLNERVDNHSFSSFGGLLEPLSFHHGARFLNRAHSSKLPWCLTLGCVRGGVRSSWYFVCI